MHMPSFLTRRTPLDARLRNSGLALLDQTLVSGTNFLTTVLIGRICGAEELGIYTLGFTVVIFFTVILESLISTPYTIYVHRLSKEPHRRYAGSVLVHALGLSGVVALLLVLISAAMDGAPGGGNFRTIFWILSVISTFELLRQFARRFSFAEHEFASALLVDVVVAAVQLGGLAWLITGQRLSAGAAFVVLGMAGLVAAAVWIYRNFHRFHISLPTVMPVLRQNFQLGRWIFAGRAVSAVNNNMLHWILALLLGTVSTGVFSACMTIVMFSNPLFLGASNILGPRAARSFARGGAAEVRQVVWKAILYLSTGFFLFCIFLFTAGEIALQFLYNGPEYAGHGNVINLLGLHLIVSGISMALYHGLVALERPDVNLKANLVALAMTLAGSLLLLPVFGILGAALSLLFGNVISTALQGFWFLQLTAVLDYSPAGLATKKAPR